MKKAQKQSRLQELDAKLQLLNKRRTQAYTANMSQSVINQLTSIIEETELDMYTETELMKHRAEDKGDGEDFIV